MTLGIVIGWGNLNGVMSSNIYQVRDKPLYRKGHAVVLAYLLLFLTGGSTLLHVLLRRENAKRRRGEKDYLAEGKTEDEVQALGDVRYVCPQLLSSRQPFANCNLAGPGFTTLLEGRRGRPCWMHCLTHRCSMGTFGHAVNTLLPCSRLCIHTRMGQEDLNTRCWQTAKI